jgi:OOP family OmpA-OmpF porin
MRLPAAILVLLFMLAGAGLSYVGAMVSVNVVEDSSEIGVRRALDANALDWAEVQADGLQVLLTGTAPTEALRFKALSTAGGVVDAARVVDGLDVQAGKALQAPKFSIEILRNDSGVSLIGLVPSATDKAALIAAFEAATDGANVADLLESADYPAPAGWDKALEFAITSAGILKRSKISMSADLIDVSAVTDSAEEKAEVEAALFEHLPTGLGVDLDVSAPRPVITPFTLRFVVDENGARFDACSADDAAAVSMIETAAKTAGLLGEVDCTIGLGVPSPSWGEAASQAILGLGEIGAGSVTLSDVDVHLIAFDTVPQDVFDTVVGELENSLPDLFSLHPELLKKEEVQDLGPPEFTATLSPEGQVQLRGRLPDNRSRDAVESYAKAQFASSQTYMAARLDPTLPAGWSIRTMIALEALAMLNSGSVVVEPDAITLSGRTGDKEAKFNISRLLSEQLGQGESLDLDVTYLETLDPSTLIPTPEECLNDIRAAAAENKIRFEPSSATVTQDAQPTMDRIAEILLTCGPIRLEIQGYTDSQGRESMNLTLSQSRAEAVIEELMNRRILVSNVIATGYGEVRPIADNETEEGREANRRIEFHLYDPANIATPEDTEGESNE